MSLSKKSKNILLIVSLSIVSLAIVVGIFLLVRSKLGVSSIQDSMITNSVIEKDSYEESRDWELDSLNYDEANTESKIRKTGVINVTVDNIDSSSEGISKVVDKYGGSIVSSSQRGEGSSEYISITIKTPVEYFEDTYNDIKNIDGDITSASYYTDEVTQQYTDLESRLKNLESTEDQLVNILNDATTVEDTLAVYEQLTSIRSQIEVIKGQIKYLDNQVDYSYLTVNLSLSDTGKEVTDEQWKPLGVIKSAFSALIAFGIFIADALIWLIVFIPVVAIVLGVVLLVKRLKNKKK